MEKKWTMSELGTLRAIYPTMRNTTISKLLGRSVTSIYGAARRQGLVKSKLYRSIINQESAERGWKKRKGIN